MSDCLGKKLQNCSYTRAQLLAPSRKKESSSAPHMEYELPIGRWGTTYFAASLDNLIRAVGSPRVSHGTNMYCIKLTFLPRCLVHYCEKSATCG